VRPDRGDPRHLRRRRPQLRQHRRGEDPRQPGARGGRGPMNLGDVEHQLRAGPPEEDEYRVRPLVLDAEPAAAPGMAVASSRTLPGAAGGPRVLARGLVVAALAAAASARGRLPAAPRGPAAAGPGAVRVQPAFVSETLRQAFYSGADRTKSWMVCAM